MEHQPRAHRTRPGQGAAPLPGQGAVAAPPGGSPGVLPSQERPTALCHLTDYCIGPCHKGLEEERTLIGLGVCWCVLVCVAGCACVMGGTASGWTRGGTMRCQWSLVSWGDRLSPWKIFFFEGCPIGGCITVCGGAGPRLRGAIWSSTSAPTGTPVCAGKTIVAMLPSSNDPGST